MNTTRTRHLLLAASLLASAPLALALAAPPQQTPMQPMNQQQNMPMKPAMQHRRMAWKHHMMGVHNMPGTVTSVDHSTGIVKLDSLGMHLVVHFPPPTIKELKAGDSISLHLGYRITATK